MYQIAICDDDEDIIALIKEAVSEYSAANSIGFEISSFSSGELLVESPNTYDLIFLDIEMSGIDGIKTANLIRPKARRSRIVYVTNHSELALQSYSVHPFDFVVKPFKKERIAVVLSELIKYITDTSDTDPVVQLKGMDGPLLLSLKSIYAFEYTGNRRITVYTESETHCIKGSLSDIISLINSESFTSPHKSFIVNMEHIDKLTGFTLYTTNGLEVPIAQKKLKEFHNEFSRFIKNYIKQG